MNLKELDIKTLKSHARQVNIKIRQEHKEETKAKVKEMRKETSEKIKEFKAKRTEELKAKLIPLNRQGKKAMIEHLEPHKDKIKEGDNIKMTVTEADDEGEETKDYGKSKQKPYKGKVMSVKGIPTESEIDRLWEESKKAPVPPEITKQDFVKVAKSKPTVKPLHNCNKCGKGSYTPTCVKCMRKELAAEDKKKVPSIKITEAEDEGEKDKKEEIKSTQEPYKGKVKKIKGIPKDPEKIKEKYAKKEGGGKPPSEPQEYITIYKNGKPVRMRRRDKKPKAEEAPAPAEAVDEGKAARIEAEKKKRALKDAETEARLAARSAKKAAGKKIKPAEMLAAAKKKRSQLTKLIAKVQDIKMSAKDKEKFENLKERFDNDEEDFEKDYSFLQRIKNKIREPKDKADSPAPAPEQGPRNLKKGFGIKRLPTPPVPAEAPTPEVPAPKARQYIEQFSGSEGVKDLVDEAYPGLKKKQQRVKFNQLAGYFRNVRNENSTEKEILEEEIEDPDEKELFKYLIRNNIFMGAAEYNKKKKQQDKDQAKFNAQFEADRHALDFHNA